MKDFRKKSLSEQIDEKLGGPVRGRTNYRCAAKGCPNAGCIDDRGEDNPGKCYWHWTTSPNDWGAMTRRILSDDSMRNHGPNYTSPGPQAQKIRAQNKDRQPGGNLGQLLEVA